jgi:hypothetical protein
MSQSDQICTICELVIAPGLPVMFDGDQMLHLDCYSATEGTAKLVHNFLLSRGSEVFCYTCLARHLTRDQQEVEKAATALRVDRDVAVKPGVCSTCAHARVTLQAKRSAATSGIRDVTQCAFCRKLIGTVTAARTMDGAMYHAGCADRKVRAQARGSGENA